MRLVDIRRPRVLLGVDHKWRDLPAYAYLKVLLEKRFGFDVALIRRTWERSYLSFVRPDIVVFEALFYPEWIDLARELHGMGVKIVVLPTEGAPANEPGILRVAGKQYDYSMVDLFCSWNLEIRNTIQKLGTMPIERVEVTGGPRFDIYRPPLNALIEPRDEMARRLAIDPKRPTVTFATNFIYAGMAERNAEFLKRDWELLKLQQTGVAWYKDPNEMATAERETRSMMMDAALSLQRDLGGANIILRPHPAEDQVYYRDFARQHADKGFRLAANEYIWDVINLTDVLISRTSTVTVEAWFMDKPAVEFQFNPRDFSRNYWKEFGAGSDGASTYSELLAQVKGYCGGARVSDPILGARAAVIARYFHKVDGNSSRRFGEALRRLAETIEHDRSIPGRVARRYVLGVPRWLVRQAKSALNSKTVRKLLGREESYDYLGRFDRFIYPPDIRRMVDTVSRKVRLA